MGVHRHDHDHLIPTADPDVHIEHAGDGLVVYANRDGERWVIVGVCNGCGVCDGNFPHAGPPDGRLDIPVRPEGPPSWSGCTLRGEYL